MKNTFTYNGFTFRPVRQLNKKENAMDLASFTCRFLKSNLDRQKQFSVYDDGKWNYGKFYECARTVGAGEIDIFKCLDDGKLYIPGQNELFIFMS